MFNKYWRSFLPWISLIAFKPIYTLASTASFGTEFHSLIKRGLKQHFLLLLLKPLIIPFDTFHFLFYNKSWIIILHNLSHDFGYSYLNMHPQIFIQTNCYYFYVYLCTLYSLSYSSSIPLSIFISLPLTFSKLLYYLWDKGIRTQCNIQNLRATQRYKCWLRAVLLGFPFTFIHSRKFLHVFWQSLSTVLVF